MSQTEVIRATIRESRGKHQARRMRANGTIPSVLYGHGKGTVSLSVSAQDLMAVLRHGGKVVQLEGDVSDSVLLREIQWDSLGNEVLHLDLTRVSASETVETSVAVELRGDAPGTRQGGVLDHVVHELEILCPVSAIPEKLIVSINSLELGNAITVADLALPEGATASLDPGTIVVHCVEPVEVPDELAAASGAEPEIIGRKDGEEAGGDD